MVKKKKKHKKKKPTPPPPPQDWLGTPIWPPLRHTKKNVLLNPLL